MTVTEFLNSAAAEIQAVVPGQSLSGNKLALWLDGFNTLVGNMSADRLFLFYVPDVEYTMASVKESYEIGPGATDFNTSGGGGYVRPVFVQSARALVGNGTRIPLNPNSENEWAANPKRNMTSLDGPSDFHYSAGVALGYFRFAPKPASGQKIYISQWNPLKTFSTSDLALSMETYYPLEYIIALRKNLAVNLANSYQRQAGQELIGTAQTALQTIRNLNNERIMGAMGQSGTLQTPALGIGQNVQPQSGR